MMPHRLWAGAAALATALAAAAPASADPVAASPDATAYAHGIVYDEVRRVVAGDPAPPVSFEADEAAALPLASAPGGRPRRGSGAALVGLVGMIPGFGVAGMIASRAASAAASAAMRQQMMAAATSHASVHRMIVLENGWTRDDDLGRGKATITKDGTAVELDLRAKTYRAVPVDADAGDDGDASPDGTPDGTETIGDRVATRYRRAVSGIALADYRVPIASPASRDGSFVLYRTVTTNVHDVRFTAIMERGRIAATTDADVASFTVPAGFTQLPPANPTDP
jgi:hypothetical protein